MEFSMKRVIALGLVCLVVLAQGCSAHKTQVTHQRAFVIEPTYPRHDTQAPRLRDLESERLRIEKMEAVTDALWATAAVARIACEIIRVVR